MDYKTKVEFVNNLQANNPIIRQKIEAAVAKQAIYTLDGGGGPTTIMKTNAKAALANPASEVNRFIWYLAFDAGINALVDGGGTVPDDGVGATVQTIVDAKRDVAWGTQ